MSHLAQELDGLDPANESAKEALNRALRALDKEKARTAELVEAVYRAARDAATALELKPVPAPPVDRRKGKREVAILMLSDWQLGKITPTYSSEVCEQRIEILGDKVTKLIDIQRADHPVDEIRLHWLGDIGEGEMIFPGQAHRIDASLYRQIMVDAPRIGGNLTRRMAGHVKIVDATMVDGNHGAIGGPVRREMHPESNGDRMFYRFMQAMFESDKRITLRMPDPSGERNWYAIDRIGNYSSLLFHGDQIRGGFAGFPWYGLAKKVWGWASGAIAESFIDVELGHWHQPVTMPLNHRIARVNGSTESDNTYAQEQLAAAGRPCQRLLFVDPERGRVTAEYLVWLDV